MGTVVASSIKGEVMSLVILLQEFGGNGNILSMKIPYRKGVFFSRLRFHTGKWKIRLRHQQHKEGEMNRC